MRKMPELALVFLAIFLITCKKNIKPEELNNQVVSDQQIFLIIERVISGAVLGSALTEPFGLAEGRDGSIYVVDRGTNRIIKFSANFEPEKQVGGYGLGTETFNRPTFAAVDNGLNIYVTDENNRRVARFDARLNFVDDIRFADEEDPFMFGYPSGIGVTSYGQVWIADREKNRLCLFNNIGRFDRYLGEFGSPEGQLLRPEKIVSETGGKFYVCDAGHSRIVIYDEFGNYSRKLDLNEIDYPIAVAIERDALWILDGASSRIFFTEKNGRVIKQFGPILPGDQLAMKAPSDVILLRDGRLVISDSSNRRLLICRIERGAGK